MTVLSYDGGRSWPVDTSTTLADEGDDLRGLAIAADHPDGSRLVAVGGSDAGRAMTSLDGLALDWADVPTEPLIDVA